MKKAATVISYLFHPLLIPTIATWIFMDVAGYWFMLTDKGQVVVLSVVFIFTFLLPALSVPVYAYFRLISSKEMETSKERVFPMVFTLLYYMGGFYMLNSLPLPSFFKGFVLAAIIIIGVVLIITSFWKISAHMAAIGGFTGSLIAFSVRFDAMVLYYIAGAILAGSIVAVARLIKEAHDPPQVYAGWGAGFLISFLMVIVY